jgi:hypothetical protein
MVPHKTCPGTGAQPAHELPATAEHFSGDCTRQDGFCPYCKHCAAEKQREWKRNNPEKVRKMKKDYRDRERQERLEHPYGR